MAAAGFRYARRRIFCHISLMNGKYRNMGLSLDNSVDSVASMAVNKRFLSLVVGLGNYTMPNTRHSIGMAVVDHLAEKLGIHWTYNRKFQGYVAMTQVESQDVILLKPKLLMNLNGRSVVKVVSAYNIQPSNVILVHDELDKPLGKFSLKFGGSAGGHNGVKSSISHLMSVEMIRLRVGIGRPNHKSQVVDYVLHNFNGTERPLLNYVLEDCTDLLLSHLHPARTVVNNENNSSTTCRKTGKKRGKIS